MQQATDVFFYKFRFVFAGICTLAFLVATSALVTAIGSHTVLDTRTGAAVSTFGDGGADTPNAATAIVYGLLGGGQRLLITTGTVLYGTCRSITTASARAGGSVGRGSAAVVGGIGHGLAFVGHGIGSAVVGTLRGLGSGSLFIIRLPGRAVGSITSGHVVSATIRPADDAAVPVISSETSTAALARLSAQQQQQISSLLAAQVAANRDLGGSIVAGDPNHGGYPAKWDAPVAQDSRVDSWGMYNRECVSYAAWKVFETYGHMPNWGGVGNANQWVRDARRAGIPTGSAPAVHSVAISMRGYYGHAMWVEKVSGPMIYVSQYNYDLHGHYSEMWVNASSFTYIYFK